MIVSDLEGFPHREVTLRTLTVGDVMRDPSVLTDKVALLAAIMSPPMTKAEIEALPIEAIGAISRILNAAPEASGISRLVAAAEKQSPPA